MRWHLRSLFPPLALPSSGSDGRPDSNVGASQPGIPSSRKTLIQLLLARSIHTGTGAVHHARHPCAKSLEYVVMDGAHETMLHTV